MNNLDFLLRLLPCPKHSCSTCRKIEKFKWKFKKKVFSPFNIESIFCFMFEFKIEWEYGIKISYKSHSFCHFSWLQNIICIRLFIHRDSSGKVFFVWLFWFINSIFSCVQQSFLDFMKISFNLKDIQFSIQKLN